LSAASFLLLATFVDLKKSKREQDVVLECEEKTRKKMVEGCEVGSDSNVDGKV